MQPDPLTELLLKTIAVFEKAYLDQCRERNENYRAKMFGNIVGFEIAAERLEAIFKLSQNRTHADNSRIIESLESSADSAIPGVAKLMKGHGLDL